MSAARRHRHKRRVVTGRGFTIHLRAFGVELDKMYRWIEDHHQAVTSILSRGLRGENHDAQMSTAGIARRDYRPDRSETLTGAAAYMREKRVLMKYLGLQRGDWIPTRRLVDYIRHVHGGGDPNPLLRRYGIEAKLMCPQIRSYLYRPGLSQASYAHYRIRPYAMLLYALGVGKDLSAVLNTDDIALSVLLFHPPQAQRRVTEPFLQEQIDRYVARKVSNGIDYETEWRALLRQVEAEMATDLHSDPLILKQKCRNAANEAWCFLIFARKVGWIRTQTADPDHWSATRQAYRRQGHTFSVAYETAELTASGHRHLRDALTRVPVWYADVEAALPGRADNGAAILNRLAQDGRVPSDATDRELLAALSTLGLAPARHGDDVLVEKRPLFNLVYDIPP